MGALITIDDLDPGLSFDPAQAQYYIDLISSFVNSTVNVSFERHENETVRHKADYYGQVTLFGPDASVSGVVRPNSVCPVAWRFDDYDLVYNLEPNTTYDITASWGYTAVPEDIKFFVAEAVKMALNNPNAALSFRVGDVTETYAANSGGAVQTPVVTLGADVLLNYMDADFTVTIGTLLPRAVQDSPWGTSW